MLIQFKDIKAGDLIVRNGVVYKMNAPQIHIFQDRPPVVTVRAKFIERRTLVLDKIFNKRKHFDYEVQHGLCLQGFYSDKIDIFKVK